MNRIKAIREAQNLTQAELAEMVGTTGPTIQRLETGARGLTIKWMDRIAATLHVPVEELLREPLQSLVIGMPVKGDVQAGVWRESESWDADKYPPLPIAADPRYAQCRQYALRVAGTSMNKIFTDGQYVVCVRWADLAREVRDGDVVIVERRRDGLVENTIKRAKIRKGRLELVPESMDPKWQLPVVVDLKAETEEIAITGLVIGRYEQF